MNGPDIDGTLPGQDIEEEPSEDEVRRESDSIIRAQNLLRIGMEMEMDMGGERESLYEDGCTLSLERATPCLWFIFC